MAAPRTCGSIAETPLAGSPAGDATRRALATALVPNVGVKTANAGVTLRVVEQSGTSMTVQLGRSADAPVQR